MHDITQCTLATTDAAPPVACYSCDCLLPWWYQEPLDSSINRSHGITWPLLNLQNRKWMLGISHISVTYFVSLVSTDTIIMLWTIIIYQPVRQISCVKVQGSYMAPLCSGSITASRTMRVAALIDPHGLIKEASIQSTTSTVWQKLCHWKEIGISK